MLKRLKVVLPHIINHVQRAFVENIMHNIFCVKILSSIIRERVSLLDAQ